MKDAMRARDTAALGAIRLILAKLKDVDIAARTEASREGVADDQILSMMQGMIKQRNEFGRALREGQSRRAGRQGEGRDRRDRALPAPADGRGRRAGRRRRGHGPTGAKSIKDMGGVMAALKAKYAGQMDFAKASAAVKKTLAG